MLMSVEEPVCKCCIPRKYKDADAFEVSMEGYENQLIDETMKPFSNSGHAFVCFDSVASLNSILKHFRTTPFQHVKMFFIGVSDKVGHFFRWMTGRDNASHHQLFDSRGRAKSNFLKESQIES
jgi:hypothetical protein